MLALAGCGKSETRLAPERSAAPNAAIEQVPAEPSDENLAPSPTCAANDDCDFGGSLSESALVSLQEIASSPDRFQDTVVHVEGRVERVCQAMGCWMELRSEGVAPVRVPMAGHAFFLPKDIRGRRAEISGKVTIRPLSEAMRRHLEAEGATATQSALSIDAEAVRIHRVS